MSASLVGSEMCIRDSGRAAAGAAFRVGSWGACCSKACLGPAPVPGTRGAVSYTHLTLPTICSV
eukprot:8690837-Alexandrium_andersonii.AAC.1